MRGANVEPSGVLGRMGVTEPVILALDANAVLGGDVGLEDLISIELLRPMLL